MCVCCCNKGQSLTFDTKPSEGSRVWCSVNDQSQLAKAIKNRLQSYHTDQETNRSIICGMLAPQIKKYGMYPGKMLSLS